LPHVGGTLFKSTHLMSLWVSFSIHAQDTNNELGVLNNQLAVLMGEKEVATLTAFAGCIILLYYVY